MRKAMPNAALQEMLNADEARGVDVLSPSRVILPPPAPPAPPLQFEAPPWSEHYVPPPPREPDPAIHVEDEQTAPAKPQAKWRAEQVRAA